MEKNYKMDIMSKIRVWNMLDNFDASLRAYRNLVCDYAAPMYGEKIIDAPHSGTNLAEWQRKAERIAVLHNNRAYYIFNSNWDEKVCTGLVKAGLA